MRAWWGSDPGDEADALDSAAVGALIDRLRVKFADRPVLVDLIDADGNSLTVGVGGEASVALFNSAGSNPPYLTSISDGFDEIGDVVPWFDYDGAETEFGVENLLALLDARRLAVEFAATGAIDAVRWTEA